MGKYETVVDMPDPRRVGRKPDMTSVIFAGRSLRDHNFVIQKVELRLYRERDDENLGTYSLITSVVYTDRGSVEMIYDEGFRGPDALGRASRFLSENLGISGVILRSIIALGYNAGEELPRRE